MKYTGASHVNAGMGAVVIAQGAHNFLTTSAKPALVAGGVVGGLYLTAAYLINKNEGLYGHTLGAFTSAALTLRMGHYYYK